MRTDWFRTGVAFPRLLRPSRFSVKMFNLAEAWGLRPEGSNPTRRVPKFKEEKRERYLSDTELARLGDVLDEADRTLTERSESTAASTRGRAHEILCQAVRRSAGCSYSN